MITATEPLEYFPRGRRVVSGSNVERNVDEQRTLGGDPVDLVLQESMQNVSISADDDVPAEFYRLREEPTEKGQYSLSSVFNGMEEELYVQGHTMVWTQHKNNGTNEQPQITFTCPTPIRFAFFCPQRFITPVAAPALKPNTNRSAICVIDKDTLHVFLEGGETYNTMLQCPVSTVWMIPDGIMLERNASRSVSFYQEEGVPWPRLFTLNFILEEMKPVLLATGNKYGFLDSPHHRVVFSSEHVSLVLMYGELSGKHYVYRLRPAYDEEIEAVEHTDESEREDGNSIPGTPDEDLTSTHSTEQRANTMSKVLGTTAVNQEHTYGISSTLSSRMNFMPGLFGNFNAHEQQEHRSTSLAPQYSLEYVMTVNGASVPMWSSTDEEMASESFLHTDLVGNRYICFLQARACLLTLLQYDETNLTVLCTHTLPARSAVSLDHINMIAVLEPTGRLVLYSGAIAVGKLHVTGLQSDCFRKDPVGSPFGVKPPGKHSSFAPVRPASTQVLEGFPRRSTLLPNVSGADGNICEALHLLSPVRPINQPGQAAGVSRTAPIAAQTGAETSSVVKLRDPTGIRFTLVLGNERHVRLAPGPIAESQLVRNCVQAMRLSLPKAPVHDFLIHWYKTRNAPGSHAGLSSHREWDLFRTLLFTMMGRPIGPPDADDRVSAAGGQQPAAGSSVCADEPKKRRRGENSHGQAADWEFLVAHATQLYACQEGTVDGGGGGSGARPYQNHELQSLYPHIPEILQTFHLLYEDLKMNVCRKDDLRLLADFLYCLAADANLGAYQKHYRIDFPELIDRYRRHCSCVITDATILTRLSESNHANPPHLFHYLEQMLLSDNDGTPFCYRPGINDFSYDMCTLIAFIYRVQVANGWVRRHFESVLSGEFFEQQDKRPLCIQNPAGTSQTRNGFERTADTVLAFLVERRYTRSLLNKLPIAIRYVILNYLEGCREYLTHGLQAMCYELLMRPELRTHSISSGLQEWVPDIDLKTTANLQERNISLPKYDEIEAWQNEMSEIEICGTASMGGVGVASGVGSVGVPGSATASSSQKDETLRQGCDEDGMGGLDDEFLQLRFRDDRRINDVRTFLNSSLRIEINIPQPPNVPDHEFLEEQERRLYMICLRTMALPIGRGMFTISSSRPSEAQTLPVPRLCLSGRDIIRGTTIEIQQIEVPANMNLWPAFHNGVAAGLRICPDTPHLTSNWITNNRHGASNSSLLPHGTDTSTEHGGFLLALGLTGHLRKLSIPSLFEYMLRSDEMIRLGLILGLSAAYRGTGDLATTRLLAIHVEALLPPTSVELDVPQNLQVASLLGVGLLYQGTGKRHMVEILLQEIGRPPGPEMENYVERESYSLTAGLALGLVTLGLGKSSTSLHDLTLTDTLDYYMNGGNRRMMVGAQKEKYRLPSFQIKEGPAVNLDVTAPGATLALGLMYFATGDEAISRMLKPPTTIYILQFVRPDLLQLRIIARHLIHWNRIEATSAWVDQQIPELLRQNISPLEEEDVSMDKQTTDEPEHASATGTAASASHENNLSKVDQVLYSQAYCSVMCGSAIAIGLRFAGTADSTAVKTLDHYLLYFIDQGNRFNKSVPERPSKFARSVGRQMIENCSMVLLLSLSLVLAGTGDIRVLRAVRMLRSRIGVLQVTYGSHMAIHMALGFLFLGGGRFTLSRTPTAIAALVCSIFPKFPTYSNDNRYHLQAFRHLYVLAIEPRIFIPRSIDTGRLCLCRIRYAVVGQEKAPVEQLAPCLLPELDTLAWIEVCDENFWQFRFDRRHNWQILESILKRNKRVDVKERNGCLTYQEDPTRLNTNHINPVSYNHSLWHLEPLNVLKLVGQQEVVNITQKLIIPPSTGKLRCLLEPIDGSEHKDPYMKLYAQFVTDCAFGDRLHALPIYLGLAQIMQKDPQAMHKSLDVWQLRLLTVALDKCGWPYKIPGSRGLLSISLLQSMLKRISKQNDQKFHRHRL